MKKKKIMPVEPGQRIDWQKVVWKTPCPVCKKKDKMAQMAPAKTRGGKTTVPAFCGHCKQGVALKFEKR